MPCIATQRESYLIRLWTEEDADHPVVRGSIQNVQTGHKTFFDAIDLPVQLLRETAQRLGDTEPRAPLR
jgi:hypothetical protein